MGLASRARVNQNLHMNLHALNDPFPGLRIPLPDWTLPVSEHTRYMAYGIDGQRLLADLRREVYELRYQFRGVPPRVALRVSPEEWYAVRTAYFAHELQAMGIHDGREPNIMGIPIMVTR